VIFHTESGTGVPVLAIHGWMPDHRLMRGCLEPVFARRPGYRRLYPDMPGMGQSSAEGYSSADDLLAAVEEFIDTRIGSLWFARRRCCSDFSTRSNPASMPPITRHWHGLVGDGC